MRAFSSRHNGVTIIFPETIWGGSVQNGLRRLEPASDAVFVLVPGGGFSSLTLPRPCGISKFNVFMESKEYSHPIKSLLTIRFQLKR